MTACLSVEALLAGAPGRSALGRRRADARTRDAQDTQDVETSFARTRDAWPCETATSVSAAVAERLTGLSRRPRLTGPRPSRRRRRRAPLRLPRPRAARPKLDRANNRRRHQAPRARLRARARARRRVSRHNALCEEGLVGRSDGVGGAGSDLETCVCARALARGTRGEGMGDIWGGAAEGCERRKQGDRTPVRPRSSRPPVRPRSSRPDGWAASAAPCHSASEWHAVLPPSAAGGPPSAAGGRAPDGMRSALAHSLDASTA